MRAQSKGAASTIFNAFGMVRPRIELVAYHTLSRYSTDWVIEAVNSYQCVNIENLFIIAVLYVKSGPYTEVSHFPSWANYFKLVQFSGKLILLILASKLEFS